MRDNGPAFIRVLNSSSPTPEGCWVWQKRKNHAGYGTMSYNGQTARAHRVSHQEFKGPIADGLCVCHSCDNPACVNPEHLWLGTPKQNARDSVRKGRRIAGQEARRFRERGGR